MAFVILEIPIQRITGNLDDRGKVGEFVLFLGLPGAPGEHQCRCQQQHRHPCKAQAQIPERAESMVAFEGQGHGEHLWLDMSIVIGA